MMMTADAGGDDGVDVEGVAEQLVNTMVADLNGGLGGGIVELWVSVICF